MNDSIDIQEITRLSLLMARKKFKINEIAKRIGCSRQTLSAFLSGTDIRDDILDRAEVVAKETGFWLPDIYPGNVSMRWEYAASDLAALANFLRSPESDDAKAERMAHVIGFYARALEASTAYGKGQ